MRMRTWVTGSLVFFSAVVAAEPLETHIDLSTGFLRDRNDEGRFAFGVIVNLQPDGWPVRPEVGVQRNFAPLFGGDETEISLGLSMQWPLGAGRLHVGAGFSSLELNEGANHGSTHGAYARGGMMWPIGGGAYALGFDAKILRARDWRAYNVPFKAGYDQFSLRMGWRL